MLLYKDEREGEGAGEQAPCAVQLHSTLPQLILTSAGRALLGYAQPGNCTPRPALHLNAAGAGLSLGSSYRPRWRRRR